MSSHAEQVQQKSSEPGHEKRLSQWDFLMRKFSEDTKESCHALTLDIPCVQRSLKQFPTGSTYEGTWDVLGMSGYGVYTFPNGVIYQGEFDDGMFHGKGELKYPSGATIHGTWNKGVLTKRTLIFDDGLEYAEQDWEYCKMPDRRFTVEHNQGLKPAGESFMTAEQPSREIPLGYYDTGDGFYHPESKVVYSAKDLVTIIRSPSEREQKWIVENCRMNPMTQLGPRPDLYEEWQQPEKNALKSVESKILKYQSSRQSNLSNSYVNEKCESRKFLEDIVSDVSSISTSESDSDDTY